MTEFSLRERKFAQTKLALLQALLERLGQVPFEAVAIKDLCRAAQVSEATFFNYFPKKSDMLIYFIQLWSIEVAWHARRAAAENSGLAAIETVFTFTAAQSARNPAVMGEIIAFQARMKEPPSSAGVSLAERRLAFPALTGVEDLPDQGLDVILRQHLEQAIARGELPAGADVMTLLLGAMAIFFGVPLAMCRRPDADIAGLYRRQLSLLWAGVRADGARARG